jgi:hypothetical protein
LSRKHRWAYRLFPFYSLRLEQLLANAQLGRWIDRHRKNIPECPSRSSLYRAVAARAKAKGNPITYLEFGVFRGASILEWSEINRHPESRFFGFDSFEGLPEDWGVHNKAGTFDVGGAVPLIDDPRVQFVKGWFQDSLPGFLKGLEPRGSLVIHLDADLHSSTMYCLTMLDGLIAPGTVLIFDDWVSALHEFRAFNEYCAAYRREAVPIAMTDDFATQAAFEVVR